MDAPSPHRVTRLERIEPAGGRTFVDRAIAVEAPIAVEINGLGYAVMMASPADLIDFAYGFVRSERLIDGADDVLDVYPYGTDRGEILRIKLSPRLHERVLERVRHRVSESSCGLCGIENLEQAMRPLCSTTVTSIATDAAVFKALEQLKAFQPLNTTTGAVHAAACCSPDGAVLMAREDVGRHNAFDKLIGAMMRGDVSWDGGFALLSSRCSYELVEKAVLADCPMLVTISAPTSLALDRAKAAGLKLVVLARPDSGLALPSEGAVEPAERRALVSSETRV